MKMKEIHIRIIGIPILALIMSLIFGTDPGETFGEKYVMALLYTGFYWNSACYMFFYFRRRFPLIKQTPKRLTYTSLSLVAIMLTGDFLICVYLEGSSTGIDDYNLDKAIPTLVAGVVVGMMYEAIYFFEQWKNTIRINEALKNQQIRTQFEVLQNQMSPHFLFNSLNTLSTLIAEDQNKAQEFTDNLSDVYRYILQNKEKDLVTLKEELSFAEAYLYLLKMRFPENLSANFRIASEELNRHIAPLTIQMLIENAIKHNVVSKQHPLHIEVYIDQKDNIVVRNNLQLKKSLEKSTKTGLDNIRRRYAFFSQKEIVIQQDDNSFLVSVPLLEVESHKEGMFEAI